jgi:hypothetical protein
VEEAALLNAGERQWRAASTLAWPLALGGAPLLLAASVPLCAFRQFTGQPCPLCGGTHACAALAQGDFLVAWQASPALLPVLALAFAHTLQLAYEAWRGRAVAEGYRIGTRSWTVAGGAMLALWMARLTGLV